jgi:SAM-dependent methyltransferase
MWKARYYVPLLGFVIPTLVIGYGFVIPLSCIAGVNELSVGFGSTVMGAVVTYFAGIRTATRPDCPVRVPFRVRVARFLNRQAAYPRGWFGWLLGVIWTFEHRREYRETFELLEIAATDHVLELGSGPGFGLREAARRASDGHVTGLDVSRVMTASARRRNRRAVRAGRVTASEISDADLDLPHASYDRAFSIHCIYFWKDPARTLRQIAVALRPAGRLVLTFRADSPDLPERFRDQIYRFFTPSEVEALVIAAGFEKTRIVPLGPPGASLFALVAEHRAGVAP